MKIGFTLLVILFSLTRNSVSGQTNDFNHVRISRVSYGIFKNFGIVKSQLLIDTETSNVYYRKNPKRKFKLIQTTIDVELLSDSITVNRLKEISISTIDFKSEMCRYHNEYGYYKIELLTMVDQRDEIYGESFLINHAYECLDPNDLILVRTYRELILNLLKLV